MALPSKSFVVSKIINIVPENENNNGSSDSLISSLFPLLPFGLFIGFDDLLLKIFIPENIQRQVAKEMSDHQDQYPLQESNNRKIWWIQRLYCFTLMVVSLVCAYEPIFVLQKIAYAFSLNTSFGADYVKCRDFVRLNYVLCYVTILYILIDQKLIQSSWRVILREFILGTIILIGFILLVTRFETEIYFIF